MVSQKQTKKQISRIAVSIKLDTLALDSHPIDTKVGNKTAKRTLKLDYIKDGGIIKAPVNRWMFGWLKELFKSKARDTVVHFPDKDLEAFPLGSAKELLIGKTAEEWNATGDRTVPYDLGEELKPLNLYPFHQYIPLPRGGGSVTKYYYKINGKSQTVPLEIYTTIPPELVVENMKSLGRIYGLGGKAGGYRIGTFEVKDVKITKVGEIVI